MIEALKIGSIWTVEHWLKGIKINQFDQENLFVLEGRNYILDVVFSGGTLISNWYVALYEDNHTPDANDNYAVPGYTETTAYDGGARPGWQPGSVSGAIITNSANKASFTFNASKTIYGGGLVGGGTDPTTPGDVAGGGKLLCESLFSSPEAVISGSVLKITIQITLAAS